MVEISRSLEKMVEMGEICRRNAGNGSKLQEKRGKRDVPGKNGGNWCGGKGSKLQEKWWQRDKTAAKTVETGYSTEK